MYLLIMAIAWIESGGNKHAIGDNGEAVGILQIHTIMVDDVNRINKLNNAKQRFEYNDRKNPGDSADIFYIYTLHYSKQETVIMMNKETKQEEKMKAAEIIARRWNGGPKGELKDSTLGYWRKVEQAMKSTPWNLVKTK